MVENGATCSSLAKLFVADRSRDNPTLVPSAASSAVEFMMPSVTAPRTGSKSPSALRRSGQLHNT